MRRHSRSRRSGPRRKMHWESANVWSANANFEINSDVMTSIIKWPGQVANLTDPLLPQMPPSDSTLVRSIINVGWLDTGDGTGFEENHIYFISFGLLAWDDLTPANAQFIQGDTGAAFDNSGFTPDPYYLGPPWIWRHIQPVAIRGSNFAFGAPLNAMQMESRAQRKLPTGTGIVLCVSVHDPQTDPTSDVSLSVGVNVRLLIKDP